MADSLRRLSNIGSFNILQEKLEKWLHDYHLNTCDQNVARGCEIIELNARVQGQLFKLLSLCASEGGLYGGASIIKSRLLPLLGHGFFTGGLSSDTSLSILADAAAKSREVEDVRRLYENSLDDLETDLKRTKTENENLKADLEDTKMELERQSRASASDKMFAEQELRDLRSKLNVTESENMDLRLKADRLDDYDRQVRNLREEVAILSGRRDYLARTPVIPPRTPPPRTPSPTREPLSSSMDETMLLRSQMDRVGDFSVKVGRLRREVTDLEIRRDILRRRPNRRHPKKPPRSAPSSRRKNRSHISSPSRPEMNGSLSPTRFSRLSSPLSIDDPIQRARQQNLIARFNDSFSVNRLDAMDILRRYSDDHESNQRIVFAATTEAFNAAKIAFRSFKSRVRSQLAISHTGPETLEEAVQDYVNSHTDMYDLPMMMQDVNRSLARNPKLYLPVGVSFDVANSFIREACRLAWEMTALAHPLDVAIATDAELYDEHRYRRSYDSEYTAPLVSHHIWPCLMQSGRVIVKGEACTRRGASMSPTRARSPTRSASRLSARSPSPYRSASPSRVSSRARTALSPDNATTRTASTSLSHYLN